MKSGGMPIRSICTLRTRCTDRYMQGSLRVQPGCHITGQAAGCAAAFAASQNGVVRDVPVIALQRKLTEIGAFLPNFNHEEGK